MFQKRCTTCDIAFADLPNPYPCTTGYSPGSLAVNNLVSDSGYLAVFTVSWLCVVSPGVSVRAPGFCQPGLILFCSVSAHNI